MAPVGLPSCARHPWTPVSERGCPQCYATHRAAIDEADPHGTARRWGKNEPERERKARVSVSYYVPAPRRTCNEAGCLNQAVLRHLVCTIHAQARAREYEQLRSSKRAQEAKAERHGRGLLNRIVVEIDGIATHMAEHARRLGVNRSTVLRRWRKVG